MSFFFFFYLGEWCCFFPSAFSPTPIFFGGAFTGMEERFYCDARQEKSGHVHFEIAFSLNTITNATGNKTALIILWNTVRGQQTRITQGTNYYLLHQENFFIHLIKKHLQSDVHVRPTRPIKATLWPLIHVTVKGGYCNSR